MLHNTEIQTNARIDSEYAIAWVSSLHNILYVLVHSACQLFFPNPAPQLLYSIVGTITLSTYTSSHPGPNLGC